MSVLDRVEVEHVSKFDKTSVARSMLSLHGAHEANLLTPGVTGCDSTPLSFASAGALNGPALAFGSGGGGLCFLTGAVAET